MPLNIGDVLKLTVFQSYLGQQVLNVQWYYVTNLGQAPTDPADIVEDLADQWYNAIRTFQLSTNQYVRAVLEVNGKPDFGQYTYAPGSAGAVTTGNAMPPYVTYAVRLNRLTKLVRNGQKRFAGVSEEAVSNGTITVAQQTTIRDAAEEVLTGTLLVSDAAAPDRNANISPIIWGGVDLQYPLGRYSFVETITVSPNVTTQNSRKVRTRDGL